MVIKEILGLPLAAVTAVTAAAFSLAPSNHWTSHQWCPDSLVFPAVFAMQNWAFSSMKGLLSLGCCLEPKQSPSLAFLCLPAVLSDLFALQSVKQSIPWLFSSDVETENSADPFALPRSGNGGRPAKVSKISKCGQIKHLRFDKNKSIYCQQLRTFCRRYKPVAAASWCSSLAGSLLGNLFLGQVRSPGQF